MRTVSSVIDGMKTNKETKKEIEKYIKAKGYKPEDFAAELKDYTKGEPVKSKWWSPGSWDKIDD